jgi:hypothetical protein
MSLPEKVYDEVLAPELKALAQKCKENGANAVIFFVPFEGGNGVTAEIDEEGMQDPAARITYYASRCNGNADKLISALLRDAEEYGHNSVLVGTLKALRGL